MVRYKLSPQERGRKRIEELLLALRSIGAPAPLLDYRYFAYACGGIGKGVRERLAQRAWGDWKFDLYWVDARLAVEVDGGNRFGYRHTQQADYTKKNCAAREGICLLSYVGECVDEDPYTIAAEIFQVYKERLCSK